MSEVRPLSSVISFQTGQEKSTASMLEALDSLRQEIVEGKVIAFAAAGVRPNDDAAAWSGSEGCVSRLRMQGALAQLLHNYLSGEVT